ncbi:helix-turn-helix transcriptional regulator [Paenibacillus cymbidii]|uniref:helix-turn-helix transcriptional regulator n=1 Tax=Paenibacillus cymbidii TaxID=1639034 RepID=UPI001081C5A0|nr:YafY family protein [Paenibacillus cymbidii]
MRADRLLTIVLLLQNHRRLTARELAEKLEVSERTVHRDMEALGAAGIPVYAERGNGGGWRLPDRYRTSLTGLNRREAVSLLMSMSPHLLGDLAMQSAAEDAALKLMAALPAAFERDARFARERIHVDGAGWHRRSGETVPFLLLLQEAVWQERQIAMTYGHGEQATARTVGPLGLVAKSNTWYMVGTSGDDIRSYRVSRIAHAELTDEPVERPQGFVLADYWERSTAEFRANLPKLPAVVRIAADALEQLRAARYAAIVGEPAPDGPDWLRADMLFQTLETAAAIALGLGSRVEVIEPPALRERVADEARRTAALYARD